MRQAIRRQFEENRHVSDLKVISHLLHKGRVEYQETMNFWKQRDHVLGKLLLPRGRPQRSFLEKFYEGTFCSTSARHARNASSRPRRGSGPSCCDRHASAHALDSSRQCYSLCLLSHHCWNISQSSRYLQTTGNAVGSIHRALHHAATRVTDYRKKSSSSSLS